MLGTILVNVYVITLWFGVGTEQGSLGRSLDGSNDFKLEGLLLGDSLVFISGKLLGSDEGIKMGLSYGKLLGVVLGM